MRESNPHERLVGPPSCLWTNRPWSRRRESNPHFEAYETSKVAVPSLRICALVDSEGIEPSSPGCRPGILPLNDEPGFILARTTGLALRAPARRHGTSRAKRSRPVTRTPALTTRRLSLRLCPPQGGPSGGIRTHMASAGPGYRVWTDCVSQFRHAGVWSARGDSNPDLHGLNVPRLPIAPRADGDHGRTRTATVQALDLLPLPNWATWPLVPLGGLEPPPRGLRARHAPLTLQREVERMAGLEPAPQGLEGPQATVTPHSLWFGLGSHQAEHGPVSFTGPSTCVGCQRPRSCELVGGKGFEPKRSPWGERGYGPSADHPLVPPVLGDSARIRTWIRELWRLGCFRYTTLPTSLHVFSKTEPPRDLARALLRA